MITDSWFSDLMLYGSPNVFNPWGEKDPLLDVHAHADYHRRLRLQSHLCKHHVSYLLIGEAPGYQGCRYSGVPFTSEKQICANTGWNRITSRALPWSEPSATIVHAALRQLGIIDRTVMWNAFPWHPHKPGEPLSNRTPTQIELDAGEPLLDALLKQFPKAIVVAVGKLAEERCTKLLMPAAPGMAYRKVHRVRHPANGGASMFNKQLRELVG